jgi:polysaccharide deacetylase family protein (PEP-CTERM system associated)
LENILTIDLEEWYHPEYVRKSVRVKRKGRMRESIDLTMRLLEESKAVATFFVVGEIAEKHPDIIEKIIDGGHEVAFHGYNHEPLWQSDPVKFCSEIKKFNSLISGRCIGFRAPSFSLRNGTIWALKVLEEMNFLYDSSVFPSQTPLYGVPRAPVKPYKPSSMDITMEDEDGKLWEFPVLVYPFPGANLPMSGGFFLRLLPTFIVKKTIKKMNKLGFPATIYVHSWELDKGTPRLRLGPYASFVTYFNRDGTLRKLRALLSSFRFTSVRNYMLDNYMLEYGI